MLIKQAALAGHLAKKLSPLYVLIGPDQFLLNESAQAIKHAWRKQGESDERRVILNQAADWATLLEETGSSSLFFDTVLIDASWDKKTIDATGKAALKHYLETINPGCLVLIRAPFVASKQLLWLSSIHPVTVVQMTPLTPSAMLAWITQDLKKSGLCHTSDIPALIQQYTEGNQLACAQVLEKLALVHAPGESLTPEDVSPHLTDQCDYPLYELAEACLTGHAEKAIHLTRQASENRTEVTLILWLLTQEIRLLIQLTTKLKQGEKLHNACSQLKIWPQRIRHYETTLKRLPVERLYALLRMSQQLDEGMKTGKNKHIWQGVEQLVIGLSSSTLIFDLKTPV